MKTPLTFGSLFAGIGGFDLGFERAGMVCKWQVDIDDYATRVLEKHWPDVRRHDDVRTFPPTAADDWRVDVICGGFPCQDISPAGNGAGLSGERSGLFFEVVRIVRELRPRFVVLENVAALLARGMGDVLGALAEIGFDAEWHVLPASQFGAPHLRERIFISANAREERIQRRWEGSIQRVKEFSWCENVRGVEDLRKRSDLPPSLFRGTRDGIPNWVDRLSCCGNAIIPAAAEWIGRRIVEAHETA